MDPDAGRTFGELLRQTRRAAGLTQESLAERAGISVRAIADLERGVARAPHRDTLDQLAAALQLDPQERAEWERLRGHSAIPAVRNAERASRPRPAEQSFTNLPVPLDNLVGRDREIEELRGLLAEARLVTLTGPGGIGKTRLALELARRSLDAFSAGVAFVDLAPLRDPRDVLPAIARTLGLLESSEHTPLAALVTRLGDQRVLLVLDNVEQVVEAASEVGPLLSSCSGLTILATSRIPLRIQGERRYPAPPLAVPDPYETVTADELLRSDAARLFVQRAQAVQPDFQVGEENAGAIAAICRRLDGLPLALELAAARITVLTPQALLTRLNDSLRLLTGGSRGVDARQQTIRNAIAWSHDLLTPEERVFFRRLSIFVGGWSLEAAEFVAADDASRLNALDGLTALVEQSLVTQREGPDGEPRFSLLETIREYGLEQLHAAGEADATGERHAAYVERLVEEAAGQLAGPQESYWLARLEIELNNLRAALRRLIDRREVVRGLQLVGLLHDFWFLRDHLNEGWAFTQATLDLPGAQARTAERAKALSAAGYIANFQARLAKARDLLEEALSIYEELALVDHIALPLWTIAVAAFNQADFAFSWNHAERGRVAALAANDGRQLARSLCCLGLLERERGNISEALELLRESLRISESVGAPSDIALILHNVGWITWFLPAGAADALDALQQSLVLCRALGYPWLVAEGIGAISAIALQSGHAEHAMRLYGAATALRERTGMPQVPLFHGGDERVREDARAALGDALFEECLAAGAALPIDESIDDAVAFRLTDTVDTSQPRVGAPETGDLTPREIEVVRLLADGRTNQEIAAELFISASTVANHVTNILTKLNLDSRTAAATWAVRQGLS